MTGQALSVRLCPSCRPPDAADLGTPPTELVLCSTGIRFCRAPRHERDIVSDITLAIGQAIREARISRELSQRELARISGIGQPNIAAIESGRRQPMAQTVIQLFAACGYELVAVAGQKVIRMPLPPEDVGTGPPLNVPMDVRVQMIVDVLSAADGT
jgi:transcriptional regulator with XRE-family HTH domain